MGTCSAAHQQTRALIKQMSTSSSTSLPYTPKNPPTHATVAYNGANFHTAFWSVPEGVTKRGRILFNHGFSEQEAPYYRFFDDLSAAGYEVFFFDQRGAGHTDPGKTRGHTDEKHVFGDLEFFVERNLKELDDGEKLFMAGHSMGGGIALNYGVTGKNREKLSGIFVSGPLIKIHPDSLPNKLVVTAGKLVEKVWPTMKMNTDLKPEYLSNNPKYQKFISSDPLMFPPIGTLRQISHFLNRGEKLLEPKYAQKFDTVPLCIVHGADDKINHTEATQKFFDLAGIKDKRIIFPENARHSLQCESEELYVQYRDYVLEFLSSH